MKILLRGFEYLTDSADQSGSGKWFRYTTKTAASITAARHEENPQVWFPFEKPICQFEPVYVRHDYVCQQQRNRGLVLLVNLHRGRCVSGYEHSVSFTLQQCFNEHANIAVVVDYQNRFARLA